MALIDLPKEVFGRNNLGEQSQVGVTFGIFELPHFFPVKENATHISKSSLNRDLILKVGTVVIAATVGSNVNIKNLTTPVTIKLALQNHLGFVSVFIVNLALLCVCLYLYC